MSYFFCGARRCLFFCLATVVLGFAACSPKRNLVYLSDVKDSVYNSIVTGKITPHIQPGDLLTISVLNVDPETSNLFNNGLLPAAGNPLPATANLQPDALHDYLVDGQGYINFPTVGKVLVANLSIDEATEKLLQAINKTAKNPIVKLAFKNFRVTVIGEVSKPGVFTIPNGKVNLFEALGLAGDMTEFGLRENVWVMHEENGNRTVTRVNVNSADVLKSPGFYLQQNDVVYVTPDKVKERIARTDTKTISIVVAAATVITIIISRLF